MDGQRYVNRGIRGRGGNDWDASLLFLWHPVDEDKRHRTGSCYRAFWGIPVRFIQLVGACAIRVLVLLQAVNFRSKR